MAVSIAPVAIPESITDAEYKMLMERISLRLFSGFFEIVLFIVISLLMISYNVFQSVKWNFIYISAVNAGTLALILLLVAGILSIFDGILELYAISSGSK